MTLYYSDDYVTIYNGDCRDVLRCMFDESVDAVVCDPPYELGFMGKAWDAAGVAYSVDLWAEALRVLKPGGHLLAFGGTRTYHRMACAIEDAGFEIRDSIHWLYGSGFPKSLDVSKAIDKAAGAEREVVGTKAVTRVMDGSELVGGNVRAGHVPVTAPATPEAEQWQGWGTALKPAHEPIVVARKPLDGTVAANVLEHGTGALNIDGCRVGSEERPVMIRTQTIVTSNALENPSTGGTGNGETTTLGRWPANFVLTHAADCGDDCAPGCPVAALDGQSGITRDGVAVKRNGRAGGSNIYGGGWGRGPRPDQGYGGQGGASRFFTTTEWDDDIDPPFLYEPKASSAERNDGVGGRNVHPTVKPVAVMEWLVRLVTPPGGLVLDPFTGSGTTGIAAVHQGFRFVGIEQDADYVAIAKARITSRPVQEVLPL